MLKYQQYGDAVSRTLHHWIDEMHKNCRYEQLGNAFLAELVSILREQTEELHVLRQRVSELENKKLKLVPKEGDTTWNF